MTFFIHQPPTSVRQQKISPDPLYQFLRGISFEMSPPPQKRVQNKNSEADKRTHATLAATLLAAASYYFVLIASHNFHSSYSESQFTALKASLRSSISNPLLLLLLLQYNNTTNNHDWKSCTHHWNYRTGWFIFDGISFGKGIHGEFSR